MTCVRISWGSRDRRRPPKPVRGATRERVMEALSDGPKNLDQIGNTIGKSYESVKSVMSRLNAIGLVARIGPGVYEVSDAYEMAHPRAKAS